MDIYDNELSEDKNIQMILLLRIKFAYFNKLCMQVFND